MKLRLEPHQLPAILLISTASLLVLKIGTELAWERPSGVPSPLQKAQDTPDLTLALQPEFVLPPMGKSFDAMLTRPLFTPSRRPSASESDTRLPSSMRRGQFTLLGVIITKEKKIAMLREIATGKVMNVQQGNEVNGMQLETLEPEKVTLKQGEEREDLVLKIQPVATPQQPLQARSNNAANPAQAAAAAPAGQSQGGRRPMSNALQELIARRRAAHGLPPQ